MYGGVYPAPENCIYVPIGDFEMLFYWGLVLNWPKEYTRLQPPSITHYNEMDEKT